MKRFPSFSILPALPRLRAVHCVAVSFAALNKQTNKQTILNVSMNESFDLFFVRFLTFLIIEALQSRRKQSQ
jgi:hypothetical protein